MPEVNKMAEDKEAADIAKLFPEPFPENSLNLKRGSVLEAVYEDIGEWIDGLKPGDKIIIGFDGEYVSFLSYSWSIEQIVDEINSGYWKITGEVIDPLKFKTFEDALKFVVQIEPRRIKRKTA